ncbi:MFS general substrate transporter [Hypoxylon sp. FL0890]|nr:MFS general substrate transporter [Hypoxylon sp. FL0890]
MAEISEKDKEAVAPETVEEPPQAKSNPEEPVKKSALTSVSQSHRTGADAALQLLEETGSLHQALDPEVNRRLVRRIDTLHISCLLFALYDFLQYVDKTAISYASVTGITESIGLKGNEFNWVASIFFFGQLAFEFPTIRLIQLFPLAKYTSFNVTLWGAPLACLAACTSYARLLVCRFFLGVLEAAVIPAWVLFTSQWYTKEEQAFRVGIWFSMCGAAQMFGGFFAYGVATHVGKDPNAALRGWQIIFLFLGLLTAVMGIAFWFVMPDSPAVARFLDKEQKGLHLERIRHNEQGIGSQTFKWAQVKEVLTDTTTWLYAFWVFAANTPNSTATSFGNILVKGIGYSSEESLLLVTPLVGAVLMATTERIPALVGYYTNGGIPIGWTTILGLQSSNVAGSTKKVTVTCIGTIAYTVGNIISLQTFQARDAPRYLPAKISICIIYVLITIDLVVMRWLLDRRNKQREQEKAALGNSYKPEENHEEFRYEV